ncbi:MAG: endonuclease V [Bacteroidia bacterium]
MGLSKQNMIACLDVQYAPHSAAAAAVIFTEWKDAVPANIYTLVSADIQDYIPGKFYLRELPPLLSLIATVKEPLNCIIIDGYCYLSDDYAPGLGYYLHEKLNPKIPVIGVAKSKFRNMDMAIEVFRGQSEKPLYITAIGISDEMAASCIKNMHGSYRMPALLKLADQLSRKTFQE